MNEHFVCIKVDREERPDIDHQYMDAVQSDDRTWRLAIELLCLAGWQAFFWRHLF